MAIPIEKSFVVQAPSDRVWEFLVDPYQVATCLPGASITDKIDEQTYAGSMTVKVGPVSSSYKGKVTFDKLDAVARVAELSGRGQDIRGKGGADMKMTSQVVERGPSETEVNVTFEVNVTGILAQFGRGMIQDVSDQMFEKFTEGMRRELEAGSAGGDKAVANSPPRADALDAVSLGATVGKKAAARMVQRPLFWVFLILMAVLLFTIFR